MDFLNTLIYINSLTPYF